MSLFGACLLALLSVLVVSARTTLEGAVKSAICLYCRRQFSSPGVFTLLVSLSLVVSGMSCSLVGFQLLQSPSQQHLSRCSWMAVCFVCSTVPVFSMRYLMVPSRVFLLQPGVRGALQAYWKAASPGPNCRCLLCLVTLCCWYVAWTWVFAVAPRSSPLIGRMTSICSTERHFTVPHVAVISGLAPEYTC